MSNENFSKNLSFIPLTGPSCIVDGTVVAVESLRIVVVEGRQWQRHLIVRGLAEDAAVDE